MTKCLDRPVFCTQPKSIKTKGQVIILGNAYGVMPYQKPLASIMATRGFESYWFPFSGQEGLPGEFSIRNGAKDLCEVVQYIKDTTSAPDKPLFVIAHCVSSLITMEYIASKLITPIKKVISYGLLAEPARLRLRAEPRLIKSNVRSGMTEEEWNYPVESIANSISNKNIPFLFCHADDTLNRRRSLPQELEKIATIIPDSKVKVFSRGYDKKLENIDKFVQDYFKWIE